MSCAPTVAVLQLWVFSIQRPTVLEAGWYEMKQAPWLINPVLITSHAPLSVPSTPGMESRAVKVCIIPIPEEGATDNGLGGGVAATVQDPDCRTSEYAPSLP